MKKYKKAGLQNYSRFINQMIDKNIWAKDKGPNRLTNEFINLKLSEDSTYHQLKQSIKYKFYPLLIDQTTGRYLKDANGKCVKQKEQITVTHNWSVEGHLNACKINDVNEYVYYSNSPFKFLNILTIDIDQKDKVNPLPIPYVNKVLSQLQLLFPGCYHDYGTSGNSLHFYIIFSFNNLDMLSRELEDIEEGEYRRELYKRVVEYIKTKVSIHDKLKIDFPKGTCSSYHKGVLTCTGSLCKLPKVVSDDDYTRLFNSSTFSETDILSLLPSLSSIYGNNSGVKREKKTLALGYSGVKGNNIDFSVKTKNNYYKDIPDTFERVDTFIRDYFRYYYKQNKRLPELVEVKDTFFSFLAEDGKDKDREGVIGRLYPKLYDKFDAKKITTKDDYRLGRYYKHIEEYDIEDITAFARDNSSFKGKIRKEDIDIVLGYIVACFTLNDKEELKGRIAQTGLKKRYQQIQDYQEEKIPKFCKKKVRMIFKFLQDMKYIKCEDDQYKKGQYGKKYKPLKKLIDLDKRLELE